MFFDQSRPDREKRARKANRGDRASQLISSPIPPAKSYQLFSSNELIGGGDRTLMFDCECFKNYFLVAFKCTVSHKVLYFEDTPLEEIDRDWLGYVLHRFRVVGFNSRPYDLPLLTIAMQGVKAPKLKEISDEIIIGDMQAYEVERKYGAKAPHINHIDLIDVAPITASLKIYGGRLHCERMQDLPYPPDTELNDIQAAVVRDYCINDLDVTHLLFDYLTPQIELREELGREYNLDLRSKSDAQIAEAVICGELERIGINTKKPSVEPGYSFKYIAPAWLKYTTPDFQHVLDVVTNANFVIGNSGATLCPQELDELRPRLGFCTYRIGIGGLHSSEESVCWQADANTLLIDRDVARYYPSIILNEKLFPAHLGEGFLTVYNGIVTKRDMAKTIKDKKTDQSLKIVINGAFGKLSNMYSRLYSPNLGLQVTVTGQLALLMLIEMVEGVGIPIVSANTDGIVMRCPVDRYADLDRVVMIWENLTGFVTEETRYKGLYSRDVNNYIAIKENGEIKTKGVYSEVGSALNSVLSKNPEGLICSEAVQAFLAHGVPLEQTIGQCKDVRKFVSVRTVKGGAEKAGVYLGKAVRWYYAKGETGTINYIISGNNVPKSEGAKPLMILPPEFPADVDLDRYYNNALDILYDIGFYQRAKAATLL